MTTALIPASPLVRENLLSEPARQILSAYDSVMRSSADDLSRWIRQTQTPYRYYALARLIENRSLPKDHALRMLQDPDPAVRALALANADKLFGQLQAAERWAEALRDRHPVAARAAFEALETVSGTRLAPILLDALDTIHPSIRPDAIRALGRLKYRKAAESLDRWLASPEPGVVAAVCETMVQIQGHTFIEGAIEYLRPDLPAETIDALLDALASSPQPVHFTKIIGLLKQIRDRAAFLTVVRHLALWPGPGVDTAISLLGHKDGEISEAAREGLLRVCRQSPALPPGIMMRITKQAGGERGAPLSEPSAPEMEEPLNTIVSNLRMLYSKDPSAELWQLLFLSLTEEKRFLKDKIATAAGGGTVQKLLELVFSLPLSQAAHVRAAIASWMGSSTQQDEESLRLARLIQTLGEAGARGASKQILRHLDSPQLVVQMAATEALGKIGSKLEAQEIEARINGAHWMVRARMADALGRLAKAHLSPGLIQMASDAEALVRFSAVRAMESIRNDKITETVMAAFADPDDRVRSCAVSIARSYPRQEQVLRKVISALRDHDARVRANAVESVEELMKSKPKDMVQVLEPMLRDANARVVINTAKALFPADPVKIFPILNGYLSARDANLRAGACWALGKLDRPDACLTLLAHLREERSDYVRGFIETGLKAHRDNSFVRQSRWLLDVLRFGPA